MGELPAWGSCRRLPCKAGSAREGSRWTLHPTLGSCLGWTLDGEPVGLPVGSSRVHIRGWVISPGPGETVGESASWGCSVVSGISREGTRDLTELRKDRLPLQPLHRHLVPSTGPTMDSDTRVVAWQQSRLWNSLPPSTAVRPRDSSPDTPRDCLGGKPGRIVGMRQIEQLPSEGCALFPEGG